MPDPGRSVVGATIADLDPARYDDAAGRTLDVLEGTAHGHYLRVDGRARRTARRSWLWVAGERVAAHLGPDTTLVEHGDWLAVREG